MPANANLQILIQAKNEAEGALAKLNRDLKESGTSSSITTKSARELMAELNKANRAEKDIDRLNGYIKQLGGEADQSKGKIATLWATISGKGGLRVGEAFSLGGVSVGQLAGFTVAGVGLNTLKDKMGEATDNASDLKETVNKAGVVFGAASTSVTEFGNTSARAIGQSKQQAMEAAGAFGNILRSSGLAKDEAAKLSVNLVRLGSDLGSLNNDDPSIALEKLRSGIVGEAEPLRTYGILLSETAVAQKALAMGLGTSADKLTEGQKVLARYALIMEQSRTAQGDFARTADELANSTRRLNARLADTSAELGERLLPAKNRAVNGLIDLLDVMDRVSRYRVVVQPVEGKAGAGKVVFVEMAETAEEAAARIQKSMVDAANETTRAWRQSERDFYGSMKDMAAAAVITSDQIRIAAGYTFLQGQQEAKEKVDLAMAASDLGSGNTALPMGAAGREAYLQNMIDKLREMDQASKQAGKDAEAAIQKGITEASQRAASAVQGLQSAINDLSRTPLLGSKAFRDRENALDDQISAAELKLTNLQIAKAPASQIKAQQKIIDSLSLRRRQAGLQEDVTLGGARRTAQEVLNPTLPELTLSDLIARVAAAKGGLAGAQAYQGSIQQNNNVTVKVEAGGAVSVSGGDAGLGQAIGDAVNQAMAAFVQGGLKSQSGVSPALVGAR